MLKHFLIFLLLALPVSTVSAQKKFKDKVVAYMDSSNVKGTDPEYIGLPRRPWAVTFNSTFEQLRLTMRSDVHQFDADYGDISFDTYMKIKPRVASSLGLWVGYRGFGFGYGLSLSGNNGMNLAVNMVTPSYGLNVRYNRFHYNNPVFGLNNFYINGVTMDDVLGEREMTFNNSMKITSLVVDGFWIFNKRKFSYSAVYDQSTRQLRSAGSFIAGLMFYYQKYDLRLDPSAGWYSDVNDNFGFLLSNDIDKFKVYQGSIGAGYTYNWVPGRNWVINLTAMPMLTIVNKLVFHQVELVNTNDGHFDIEDIKFADKGNKVDNGGVKLNLDLQMAAVYWHKDWFFKVTGQAHHFRGTYDLITTKFFDWNAKASVGYTF